jgi:hypothetical protein
MGQNRAGQTNDMVTDPLMARVEEALKRAAAQTPIV